MRVHRSIALAVWMLNRLNGGVDGRALAGDLLEELEAGRDEGWFWWQVVYGVTANARAASRLYGLPLLFSAGWSLLYPVWLAVGRGGLMRWFMGAAESFGWPYSALLVPMSGVLPLAAFVWIGLGVYLSLTIGAARKISLLRVIVGLSVGLNVLLLTAIAWLRQGMPHGMDLQVLMMEHFYSDARWVVAGVPLVLSLYTAILSVQPGRQGRAVTG